MQKESRHTKGEAGFSRGVSLVELVVCASLMLLLATAFSSTVLSGEESAQIAGQRNRAGLIAEEGLEAARNIRDAGFANLVNGTYGIGTTSNAWAFVGSSDAQGIFTRTVAISTVDSVTKQAVSTVTWQQNPQRTGSVALTTYLPNIQLLNAMANRFAVNVSSAAASGADVTGITFQNAGSSPIIIDKVAVSWTSSSTVISQFVINGTIAWSSVGPGTPAGTQASGTTLDISNFTIAAGATVPLTRMRFSAPMAGNVITMAFTMTDGSTKTVTTGSL